MKFLRITAIVIYFVLLLILLLIAIDLVNNKYVHITNSKIDLLKE